MALTEPTVEEIVHRDATAKGRSLWSDARRRFFRNRAATLSLVALIQGFVTCLPRSFRSTKIVILYFWRLLS